MICSVATTAPATIACSLSPKKQMVCSVLLEGYSVIFTVSQDLPHKEMKCQVLAEYSGQSLERRLNTSKHLIFFQKNLV